MTQAMQMHYDSNDSEFASHHINDIVNNDNRLVNSKIKDDRKNGGDSENSKGDVKQRRLRFALCCMRDLITLDHYLDNKFVHLLTDSLYHEITVLANNQFVKVT